MSGRRRGSGLAIWTLAWRVFRWRSAWPLMRVTVPVNVWSGRRSETRSTVWPVESAAASLSGTSMRAWSLVGS